MQNFKNNFSKIENSRFDIGMAAIMALFSKENQNIINEKIEKQLLEVNTIKDSNNLSEKGLTYANNSDDMDKTRIKYVEHDFSKEGFSWHVMIHEFVHFIGKPTMDKIENELNTLSSKAEIEGTQILDFGTGKQYGKAFSEWGADLIAELAMTNLKQCKDSNPTITGADDIIYTDKRYQKTDYDKTSSIARLFTIAMNNNFENKSYDELMHSDDGLLDRKVELVNKQTGELYGEVPVNDYLYGLTGNAKHLENTFDKYTSNGSYEKMCMMLDSEFDKSVSNSNYVMDKNLIKDQLLSIADMLNNKVYILQHNKCINEEQKNKIVSDFNKVFNQCLKEYNIGPLTNEDIEKTKVSVMNTYHNLVEQAKNKNNDLRGDLKANVREEKEIKSNTFTEQDAIEEMKNMDNEER